MSIRTPRARRAAQFDRMELQALESRQLLAADLIASGIDAAPQTIEPGEDFSVTVNFRNDGELSARAFRINVFLTTNGTLGDADDVLLTSIRRVSGLGAGQTDSSSRSVEVDFDAPDGDYFIGMLVDTQNSVSEESEDNNIILTGTPIITVADSAAGIIEVRGRDRLIEDSDDRPGFADGTAFGRVDVDGGSRTRSFTIRNGGDDELHIDNISINGSGASHFEIVDQPEDSLDPGESTTLRIRFDPSSEGWKRAVVTIVSDDSSDSEFTFAIWGTGIGSSPEIVVTGFLPIADGDATANFFDGTHIGVRAVGGSRDRVFTITNLGESNLTISDVTITGRNSPQFVIIDAPDAFVEPGDSTTFTVRFTPASPGTKMATVTIFNNDESAGVFDFEIRGRGRPA